MTPLAAVESLRLAGVDWFARVGSTEPLGSHVIAEGAEAAACGMRAEDWSVRLLETANDIKVASRQATGFNAKQMNAFVGECRSLLEVHFRRGGSVLIHWPKVLNDGEATLRWVLLHLCVARLIVPAASPGFDHFLEVYRAGRLPCGSPAGPRADGPLLVF